MYSKEHQIYIKKEKRKNILIKIFRILLLIVTIITWELLAEHNIINPFISSSPSRILSTIISLYIKKNLFIHIWTTIYETIISFSLGTVLGITIAIILWWNNFLYKVIDPYLTIAYQK